MPYIYIQSRGEVHSHFTHVRKGKPFSSSQSSIALCFQFEKLPLRILLVLTTTKHRKIDKIIGESINIPLEGFRSRFKKKEVFASTDCAECFLEGKFLEVHDPKIFVELAMQKLHGLQ
jgi:hypothetical protein